MKKRELALRKIRSELVKRPEVLAAYLFGSTAKGYARSGSDLDVAVLTYPKFETKDYRYQIELKDRLNQLVDDFEIDVVLVNSVGLPLQYSSVVQGKLIYSRDDTKRAKEEIKIANFYEEMRDFYQLRLRSNLEEAKRDVEERRINAR